MFTLMIHSRWRLVLSLAGGLLLSGLLAIPAQAQNAPQSGWRMPNLNPLQGTSKAQPKPANTASKPLVPNLLDPFGLIPGTSSAKTSSASFGQPKPPSTWKKMTTGTKRMANQTADFLNPFNDVAPATHEENLTGSNSMFNNQANKRPVQAAKEKKSWLPGWNSAQGTESKPKTVNDFLSQPRMQP